MKRSTNPVYQYTLQRLKTGFGRHLPKGWLVITLLIVTLTVSLPMSLYPPGYLMPQYEWSAAVGGTQFGLIVWQEVVKQTVVISAGVLAALAAGSLFKDGQQDILRLTPYSSRQIRYTMLSAVLRFMLPVLLIVMVVRGVLITISTVPGWSSDLFTPTALLDLKMLTQGPIAAMARTISRVTYQWWETWLRQIQAIRHLAMWQLWMVYYVVQPMLDVLLFSSTGLAVAARNAVTEKLLPRAAGVVLGLWVVGYLGERLIATLVMLIGDSYYYLRWMPGSPAMDSGYIVIWNLFAIVLFIIIGGKLLLLGLLLYSKKGGLTH